MASLLPLEFYKQCSQNHASTINSIIYDSESNLQAKVISEIQFHPHYLKGMKMVLR